jgi:uncharacterized YigZ family protein
MEEQSGYLTIKSAGTAILREKGSSFHGYACMVDSEITIRSQLAALGKAHPSATHCCFAWKLGTRGDRQRMNDDGEPPGTAGRPIMDQIRSKGITDVLVAVVRYFGGALLGKPGLIKCYGQAASAAINKAIIFRKEFVSTFTITFPHEKTSDVMKLLRRLSVQVTDAAYGEPSVVSFIAQGGQIRDVQGALSVMHGIKIKQDQ